MTREEFLQALRDKLAALPIEERDDAVKYYSEYLDEAGAENEQQAIDELGDIQRVANVIIANSPAYQSGQCDAPKKKEPKLVLDDKPPEWTKKQPEADSTQPSQPKYNAYQYSGEQPDKSARVTKLVVLIILCVIFVPVIFSVLVSIISVVFGIIFGVLGACVALIVSAIVCIASSVTLLGMDMASGLATFGMGLVCAAAGLIIGRAMVMLGLRFVPKIVYFVKFVFYKIKGKVVQYI